MDNSSFGAHAYSVSSPMQGSSSGPDLTSLFVTSKSSSDTKQKEAETSMSNGYNVEPASPPPVYNSVSIAVLCLFHLLRITFWFACV